jgi:tRNA G18 (ribose-2'-O)-methylase SpoU
MGLVGYKWYDAEKTRRSAEVLHQIDGEPAKKFEKRCIDNGFEPIDSRNVVDHYKFFNDELIKGDLNARRHNYSILCVNLINDFNIASVIRANNAFCGKEIILFGNKKYDRRGTVGTHTYENFRHVRELDELGSTMSEFDVVVGIDNVASATAINEYTWQHDKKTLIVLGQESIGIPGEIMDMCNDLLFIKQYGSVRSLNVAQAAAIVMYDYCSKII